MLREALFWIRIQEGKNDPQKEKKACSLLRAEGFSCTLDVLCSGHRRTNCNFWITIFGHQNPGSRPISHQLNSYTASLLLYRTWHTRDKALLYRTWHTRDKALLLLYLTHTWQSITVPYLTHTWQSIANTVPDTHVTKHYCTVPDTHVTKHCYYCPWHTRDQALLYRTWHTRDKALLFLYLTHTWQSRDLLRGSPSSEAWLLWRELKLVLYENMVLSNLYDTLLIDPA
jgi:hypothetical protein